MPDREKGRAECKFRANGPTLLGRFFLSWFGSLDFEISHLPCHWAGSVLARTRSLGKRTQDVWGWRGECDTLQFKLDNLIRGRETLVYNIDASCLAHGCTKAREFEGLPTWDGVLYSPSRLTPTHSW